MSQQEQIDYWNGQAGEKWVARATQLNTYNGKSLIPKIKNNQALILK